MTATLVFALSYWAFAGQLSVHEALAMILPLVAATALTGSIHRVAERRFDLRAPWGALVLRTCISIGKDCYKVGVFLGRSLTQPRPRDAALLSTQPFHFGDDAPHEATRRALALLSVSASPDRYVIDVARDDTLRSHSLVGQAAKSDREWPV